MEALVATFRRESSFLIDLPFTTPPQPAVLSVPRHGATRVLRKRRAGSSSRSRVPQLVWDEQLLSSSTRCCGCSAAAGRVLHRVSGTIGGDGTVRGRDAAARRPRQRLQPCMRYVGRHTPVKVRSWKSEVRRQKTSDFQTSDL